MTGDEGQRYWRQLGIAAMVAGACALAYLAVALVTEGGEPLMGVFVLVVGVPAIAPSVLGYFMCKGSRKAAWALRVAIVVTLLVGAFLDVVAGLDVLSLPALAIPLIAGSVLWLALSFV